LNYIFVADSTRYASIFDHFDIIGPKVAKFSRLMQNNSHYAIQGHRFDTNQKPICDLLLVTDTNLHPILHHFHFKFELLTGGTSTN